MNVAPPVAIQARNLGFAFRPGSLILSNVNLTVQHGERVAVMGGSGSGKTTLLKMVAGLRGYKPVTGECWRSGRLVLVFQQPLLLDHMNVRSNILLPARLQNIEQPIEDIVRILDLEHLLDRFPYQLSGGQQRRVALARALTCPNAEGLLMDEPFSGLDEPLRERILVELEAGLNATKLTSVLATHSPFEAAFFSDRVVFLNGAPATVVAEHVVRLPRARRHAFLETPDMFDEVAAIRKHLGGHCDEATPGDARAASS